MASEGGVSSACNTGKKLRVMPVTLVMLVAPASW